MPREEGLDVVVVPPSEDLAEFLLFNTPDLVLLGVGESEDGFAPFFESLDSDPWLASLSFLLVSPDNEAAIERYGRHRVSYFLEHGDLDRMLPRVLPILLHADDAFRGSGVVDKLTPLFGEMVLDTDLSLVQLYAGLFANWLHKEGRLSAGNKYGFQLAMIELLVNAMEHGNAGITYEEKSAWLESGRSAPELVAERMKDPKRAGRKVRLSYRISPAQSSFQITDEGDGFDVSALPDPAKGAALLGMHGRGIVTSRGSVDRLLYNAKGNSVTIEINHDGPAARSVPPGFIDEPPLRFAPGEVVFSEGEVADDLYYIVSGEWDLFVKGKRILTAVPSDVYLGEMSFVLGSRRGATVVARREGELVRISRDAFARAVKRYPSYAIFLCKLLAQRLRDAHARYAELVMGS